jgi:integrase
MTTRIDIRLRDPETGAPLRVQPRLETDERTARAIATMVRELWTQAQYRPVVKEIANGRRDALAVYERYRASDLKGLAPIIEDRDLEGLVDEWLPTFEASDAHKHRIRQCFVALAKQTRKTARLSDLPDLVREYRVACVAAKTPRAFNYAKMAALALLRERLGRRHPLWLAVADVKPMTEKKRGVSAMTPTEALAIRRKLEQLALHPHGQHAPDYTTGQRAARIWWALCTTGMGATELWGEWTVLEDRVRIVGTKREGRRWGSEGREVPRVSTPVRPEMSQSRFVRILMMVGASPYQGRHSYATWLEDAEIPRTRRRLYLGHAARDVTDRYERREVTTFLAEDAARFKKVLAVDAAVLAAVA